MSLLKYAFLQPLFLLRIVILVWLREECRWNYIGYLHHYSLLYQRQVLEQP